MKKTLPILLFLLSNYWLNAAVISVSPGTKTIYDAVATAQSGDILELNDGVYNETSSVIINKPLIIRSATNTSPIIKVNRFTVRANFTLQGVVFDGNSTASEGFRIDEGQNLVIKILNSDIQNFTSRAIHFYATSKTVAFIDTLIVDGCKFQNTIRALQATTALEQFKHLEIKNSTFYKLDKDGYFINVSPGVETISSGAKVIIDHCTFYNCFSRRGVYLANLDGAEVTNNIAFYSETVGDTKSFSTYGSNSMVRNNISYNVDLYGSAPRQNVIVQNPLFVDSKNGNLQLYANSPAIGAGDNGSNLGDPNWGVSNEDAPLGALPYVPFKKPYTMSPTANSVRVMWQMLDTISKGVVYYGKTEALGDSIVSNDGWLVEGEGFVHVKELTGLDAGSTYFFQVGDGVRRFEDIQQTKTSPAKSCNFRLAIASDFHDNSGQVWEKMVPKIVQQAPDLFIHLGDIVNKGDTRPWNSSFFSPSEPLLSRIPMMGAVGNHETGDKPSNGPTTYYDYFSSFSHGYIDGTEGRDPRGESYYATDYGDVKIISLNLNGDESSPTYETGSQQMTWLDNQIQNADSKWIFIISHVSVYSTGYHGQWSADKKTSVAPILEKHAANGKHIIFFSGNCHSFEHLYKSGVHYVRPSVAASNIREQFNMADLPYSLIWKSINSFSTIDVSDDGETVTMISRNEDGQEFYSYVFTRTAQMLPSLYFTEPDGNNDTVTDVYRIKWTCFDETGNGKINLYHSIDSINGTLIAENLSTDLSEIDYFDWHVRYLQPKGDYFIYGIIDDGINPPVKKYARGKVSVVADTTAPPAPTSFTGYATDGQIVLNWQNPTRLMDVENRIDDFENGIGRFTGVPHAETATGSLEMAPGYNGGNALKINYNVLIPWGQYSAVLQNSVAQNYATTPYLEFWFKGDGSSRNLRLMIKQDLDINGTADDWWYDESLILSSTDWQKVKLDIRTFKELSWHTNASKSMNPENIFAIEFIIPSGTIGAGSVEIDNIVLTGQIYPAPDFEGTKVLRRTDRFPANHNDGDLIYNGIDETFIDSNVTPGTNYYYAGFTFDDLNNFSDFDSNASWQYLYTSLNNTLSNDILQVFPNPAHSTATIRYSVPNAEKASIFLEDLTGKRIYTIAIDQPAGNYQINLNTNELASGIYFIRMNTLNQTYSTKIIINKQF